MRTKTLLLAAAAVAAGIISVQAQSNVYSANIVGYVNINYTAGQLAFIADPMVPAGGDYNITNSVKLADPGSDGTSMYLWNTGTSSWDIYSWIDGYGWFPDVVVNLGTGFFLQPVANGQVTFVGEVKLGNTNTIPAGFSVMGSSLPIAGPNPGGAVGNDGDNIYTWDGPGNQWITTSYIGGYGWFDGISAETNGPSLQVGEAFFYQNTGSALTWEQPFTP